MAEVGVSVSVREKSSNIIPLMLRGVMEILVGGQQLWDILIYSSCRYDLVAGLEHV